MVETPDVAEKKHFPLTELERIVHEMRHLRGEHSREGQEGSWRRRLGERMLVLERELEDVLTCWVADPVLREDWRAHAHRGAPAPNGPVLPISPVFVGQADSGARVEVLPLAEGGYEVRIGGQQTQRLASMPSLSDGPEACSIVLYGQQVTEIFDSEPSAIEAFERSASAAQPPPQQWVLTLLFDGLIDRHLGVTDRGRRLLARGRA